MVDETSKNYYKCPYELLKYRTVIFKKKKKKKKTVSRLKNIYLSEQRQRHNYVINIII